ncbi:MAG: hypothetical protein OEN01_11260, partial [Candidatus Krumholzibacteria bacterium]|nr:hypothetical protein [Candidatus Krumholzibacteria bacterium]
TVTGGHIQGDRAVVLAHRRSIQQGELGNTGSGGGRGRISCCCHRFSRARAAVVAPGEIDRIVLLAATVDQPEQLTGAVYPCP